MTQVIHKHEWKRFFDIISRERFGWETAVQVLDDDAGAQIMSEGLAFTGMTFEVHGDNAVLELLIGRDAGNHQTHNIFDPKRVAYELNQTGPGGTLDIEDASGTKTLINFYLPKPTMLEFKRSEMVAVG